MRHPLNYRKHYTVLACILMLMGGSLSACSGNGGSAESKLAPTSSTGKAQDQSKSISMMVTYSWNQPQNNPVLAELEKKTGYHLDISWIPDNIYTDKMMSVIAAGTLPMVLQIKASDLKHPVVMDAVKSGAFWEIGPYLKDFPYLSRYVNTTILQNTSYFGKMYGLYKERPISRQGIQYRKDWLDRLGLSEPHTLDELYKVLKAFTLNDPDGNGKNDTYGLIDRNDLVYGAFKNIAAYSGAPNNWGVIDGKLTPDFMTKPYIDAMNFMKKLVDEKLVNPDFPTISKEQQEQRFLDGQAGMMISNLLATPIIKEIQLRNANARVDIINRIQGPTGEHVWGSTGYGGLFVFPKSSVPTEADLRLILAFFDRTLSEDVNNLITYGIQDRHYTKVDNTVKISPDTKDLRLYEVEEVANSLRTFDVHYLEPAVYNEMQMKISRYIQDNSKIVISDPTTLLVSPTYIEKGTDLQTIITNATYNYMLGTIDLKGFQNEVDKWRNSGGDRIIEEMNQAYGETKK